jgi:putative FmdB family regulatory protein
MPTYQYRCTECGSDLEAVQKFTDPALTECPTCSGSLRKVFNAVGVVFKGSGFYRTDSRAGASANGSSESKSEGEKSDSGKPSEKSGEKAGEKSGPAEKVTASSDKKAGAKQPAGASSSSSN